MTAPDPLWTLDELAAEAALALAAGYDGQASGRVRDVPDRRTIRYYTTLGLLDRPAELRGRTALYGRKHLLQLVAIKRLQARGASLAEVQQRLLGLTEHQLADLAQLPAGSERGQAPPAGAERADRFWREIPPAGASAEEGPAQGPAAATPRPLVGVPLAGGVTLLLDARRALDDHDLSALHAAAAPLLQLLRVRRLLGPGDASPLDERNRS